MRNSLPALVMMSLLVALTAAPVAHAVDVTLNTAWDAPTTREDGAPLTPDELGGWQLYYSVDGGAATKVDVAGGGTRSHALTIPLNYRPTPYTVGVSLVAVDSEGRASKHSNIVSRSYRISSDAPPSAPTGIEFSVSCPEGCRVTVEPL